MWKYMRCASVVGRARRSPATPGSTARRSVNISTVTVNRGFGLDPARIRSIRSSTTSAPGEPRTRTLLDELEELGFGLSYQSLTRNIRQRSLRPVCEACRTATERPNAVIPHAPGDETQWDWLELPNPPEFWGWGKTAHLLVGSL